MKLFQFLVGTFAIFLGSLSPLAAKAQANSPLVAVISTQSEPNESFSIAEDAVASGAKYLLFPEWGFLTSATPLSEAAKGKWAALAVEKKVHIILGARYNERNTVFAFDPVGATRYTVRRDGYNSPAPTDPAEKKPFVLDTEDGRIGILICDESRSQKYFEEIKAVGIDALFVPNYVGQTVTQESLRSRYAKLDAPFDRFNSDRLSQFSGSETHVYRVAQGLFEFNGFGVPFEVGARPTVKTDDKGVTYSVSLHPLRSGDQ